jgi:hypothetical protein
MTTSYDALAAAIAAAEGLPCTEEELAVLAATAQTMRSHGEQFARLIGGSTVDDHAVSPGTAAS